MGYVFKSPQDENGTIIGFYTNGVIYKRAPISEKLQEIFPSDDLSVREEYPIGFYEDGQIFNFPPEFDTQPIGFYSLGRISKTLPVNKIAAVGYYLNGVIYKNISELEKTPVAYYHGEEDGAAATAVILNLI